MAKEEEYGCECSCPTSNDDWDATCSIYDELPKQLQLTLIPTTDTTASCWQTHIEVSVSTERLTCLRPLATDAYRVWALPPSQSTSTFRLSFLYPSDESDALPDSVHIQRLSELPHSWAQQDKDEDSWATWLQQKINVCLQTEAMSYAVVSWIEHHALEYWNVVLQNENGFGLILFDNKGPTHYDLPTLVMTFPGPRLVHHATNGRTTLLSLEQANSMIKSDEPHHIHPMVLNRDAWRPEACPICFEPYLKSQMEELVPCKHYVCKECLTTMFRVKVQDDLHSHRDNPFRCPIASCRQGLTIHRCVKHYLTPALMDRVRAWIKDVKHPLCYSLPNCLSCKGRKTMRKEAIDSALVYCDACQKRWCEWCLKRLKKNPQEKDHSNDDCDASQVIRFCERYLAAGPQARQRCDEKYPWMKVYAPSRMDRDGAEAWLKQNNGQQCPVCKTGVERIQGCFHIHCFCGAHFCYECGQEIFYPFYGTHKCWEVAVVSQQPQLDSGW